MANSIRYVLLVKPAAITLAEWQTALLALRAAMNKRANAGRPIQRLHYRMRLDDQAVLLHGDFDDEDVTLDGAAAVVRAALAPAYTLAQVRTAMTNNVSVLSHAQALALVAGPDWESPE